MMLSMHPLAKPKGHEPEIRSKPEPLAEPASIPTQLSNERLSSHWSLIEEMGDWAAKRRKAGIVGDFLQIRSEVQPVPRDIRGLWNSIARIQVHAPPASPLEPYAKAWKLLNSLDPICLEVFAKRNLVPKRIPYQRIAGEIGRSHEGARKILLRAQEILIRRLDSDENLSLTWMLHDLRAQLGTAFPTAMLPQVKDLGLAEEFIRLAEAGAGDDRSQLNALYRDGNAGMLKRFVLWLAGPYVRSTDWLVTGGISIQGLREKVFEAAKHSNGLTRGAALELLAAEGMTEQASREFLRGLPVLREFNGQFFPWKGTVGDKAEVVLEMLGRPVTDMELNQLIGEGHSLRSLRNQLMTERRFTRTNRHEFSLRTWGFEEYQGISEEIAKRIERGGGEAHLNSLVSELLRTFDIAESSVRQYAAAYRFIVENGMIRLRDEEVTLVGDDPLTVPGVYRPAPNQLRWAFAVTHDTIRGSGRTFPPDLALALGVQPGAKQEFHTELGKSIPLAWRMKSPSGPSIGSVSALASHCGARVGDMMVLAFGIENRLLTAKLIPADADDWIDSTSIGLTGITDEMSPMKRFGMALGVSEGEVLSALRHRGDKHLAERLEEALSP